MSEKRKNWKYQLPEEEKKSLHKARQIFMTFVVIAILVMGILVSVISPIYTYFTQYNYSTSALSQLIVKVDNLIEDGLDVKESPYKSNDYFVVAVPKSALDDGLVDQGEIEWYLSGDNLKVNFFADSKENYKFFTIGEGVSHSFLMVSQSSHDGESVFLAGKYFAPQENIIFSTILMGSLSVFGCFIFLVAAAFLFSKKVFEPVVASLTSQREFVADASHELKTPISIISADVDVLKEQNQVSNRWLDDIDKESLRLSDMVNGMVQLTAFDSKNLAKTRIDVSSLLLDCCLSFDAVCYEKGISFDYSGLSRNVFALLNGNGMRKVFEQLIDDAIKYVDKDKKIKVSLLVFKNVAICSFLNSGCTIKDEEKNRMFDRFFRTAAQRAGPIPGTGLGLAICKAICEKNGCTISLKTVYGKSTEFLVRIPL